jgi:hypothetical protein
MTRRHFGIDVLKVLCAQLIVLHHGMLYAPEQLNFMAHWPGLSAFLLEPGRWVVHVFLVIGGYLSALALQRVGRQNLTVLAWRRYLRLMPMFIFSLFVTVLVAWWVRHDYAPDFISPMPTWQVWFAHLTLSFDWMDLGAISAGAWYVAIDFQLDVVVQWRGPGLAPLAQACGRHGGDRVVHDRDQQVPATRHLGPLFHLFLRVGVSGGLGESANHFPTLGLVCVGCAVVRPGL